MPTNQDWSSFFFGEFYWSPIYKAYELESSVGKIWTDEDQSDRRFPRELLNTSFQYSWEVSSDFSLENHVRLFLPTKVIAEEMGLRADFPGKWINKNDETAAIDPAVIEDGPSALLFNRKIMSQYLRHHNLSMFWTVEPERKIFGQSHNDFIGHVEANGLYWFEDGNIDGELTTSFIPKGHWVSPETSRDRSKNQK